eukprot:gene6667-4564_t
MGDSPPLSELSPLFVHPRLRGEAASTQCSDTPPPWTLDMDDMLRGAIRRGGFNFERAAREVQMYILKLRAGGGILPDAVIEPLYTPTACRERWASIDLEACKLFHKIAAESTAA